MNNLSEALASLPARKPRRAGSRRVNNGVYILSSAAVGSHCVSDLEGRQTAAAILSIYRLTTEGTKERRID